jgi:hypothetical protein
LLSVPTVRASTITFAFTGSVTSVDSRVANAFSVGDALAGIFVFDSAAVGFDCGTDRTGCTQYLAPTQSLSATVGSYAFSGITSEVLFFLAFGPITTDVYRVDTDSQFGGTSISGPPVNGLPLSAFTILLGDQTGTALTNGTLVPPVFADYNSRSFYLNFGPPFPFNAQVSGTLSSLTTATPAAIPEPASLVLLGSGLCVGARRSWRRRRGLQLLDPLADGTSRHLPQPDDVGSARK